METKPTQTGHELPMTEQEEQTYESLSLGQLAWRRFRRHRLAMWAGAVLILMYIGAIFAPFFAPYEEGRSNRQKYFHPPTKIHFFDEDGKLTRPYVYNYRLVDVGRRLYEPDTSTKYPIKFFVNDGPEYNLFFGLVQSSWRLYGVDSPAVIYPFGGDHFGRDLVSRLLYGSQKSLFIALPPILVSLTLGLLIGGVAGYFGGIVDNILMRITEVLMSIPGFYLLLTLAAILVGVPAAWRFPAIVLLLSLVGWSGLARVIRGMVLSLREQEFVEGALAIGGSHMRTIVRHILPNTVSYIVVSVTLQVPGFILAESNLSFLGLGIQEPFSSWGQMLSNATDLTALSRYPWLLIPGIFIFITVLAWNFVGDGVRDAMDPRAVTGQAQK